MMWERIPQTGASNMKRLIPDVNPRRNRLFVDVEFGTIKRRLKQALSSGVFYIRRFGKCEIRQYENIIMT